MKKVNRISWLSGLILLSYFIFPDLPLFSQKSNSDSLRTNRSLEFQKIVNQDRIGVKRWWYGWLAGYSAATAGQGIVYFSTDKKGTRQDMALGSATTLLGAIGVLLTPVAPRKSILKNTDIQVNDTSQGRIDLVNSEKLLKEIALYEKRGRSWKMHAVTGAVNIGSGLVTWLGFKRSVTDGLVNFAINTVITEAQIWTQPVKAIKDYSNYLSADTPGSVPDNIMPQRKWYLCSYPGGFTLRLDF
jgi:hypothetical protein